MILCYSCKTYLLTWDFPEYTAHKPNNPSAGAAKQQWPHAFFTVLLFHQNHFPFPQIHYNWVLTSCPDPVCSDLSDYCRQTHAERLIVRGQWRREVVEAVVWAASEHELNRSQSLTLIKGSAACEATPSSQTPQSQHVLQQWTL